MTTALEMGVRNKEPVYNTSEEEFICLDSPPTEKYKMAPPRPREGAEELPHFLMYCSMAYLQPAFYLS